MLIDIEGIRPYTPPEKKGSEPRMKPFSSEAQAIAGYLDEHSEHRQIVVPVKHEAISNEGDRRLFISRTRQVVRTALNLGTDLTVSVKPLDKVASQDSPFVRVLVAIVPRRISKK